MNNTFNGGHSSQHETGFMISDLVSELNISARSIRYYEELGLISPKRTAGNHRIYSKKDKARLKMILKAKNIGFSLDEITSLLALYDLDRTEKSQYDEGIKVAYHHLHDVQNRLQDLMNLEKSLIHAIEQAEKEYKEKFVHNQKENG